MKKLLFALLAGTMALASSAQAAVKVVATLPSLASIAKEVGGTLVEVESLSSPAEDPHYVDARPNLMIRLNRADLLIANGLELEIGWLPNLQQSARNPKILPGAPGFLDASSLVKLMEVPGVKIDRSMGDIHPGGNPHFLFDARAAALVVKGVGERLGRLDPANAATYTANAAKLSEELVRLGAEQTQRFAALPAAKRQAVSYHKSLVYLYNWLGLQEVATVEPRPGISPDPSHVAQVLKIMRDTGSRVILQEEFYPSNTSQTIAKLVGGTVVTLHGGTRFKEGESYLNHLRDLTREVYNALSR